MQDMFRLHARGYVPPHFELQLPPLMRPTRSDEDLQDTIYRTLSFSSRLMELLDKTHDYPTSDQGDSTLDEEPTDEVPSLE